MPDTLDIGMLNDREQSLIRARADAAALVLQLERELAQARERETEATAALARFYAGDDGVVPVGDRSYRVWITGVAGTVLREAGVTDLSDQAREAIAKMEARRQGFGESFRLVANHNVAKEIADYLDKRSLAYEIERTKQARANAASVADSANRIRQALTGS